MFYSTLEMQTIDWLYGLRFDADQNTLCFDIDLSKVNYLNEFFEQTKKYTEKTCLEYQFKNQSFVLSTEQQKFGFGKIADVTFSENFVSICFAVLCKSRNPNIRKAHWMKIAQTIMLLSQGLRYLMTGEEKISPTAGELPMQLFEVHTMSYRDMHGHALQGFVHKSLRTFLKEVGELSYLEARVYRDAFRSQIKKLFGYEDQAILKFEADGGFLVQVPGNACDIGIYGDERSHPIQYGAEFQSHNVDSARQQIGLLIGLAMILGWYYEKHPEDVYWNI